MSYSRTFAGSTVRRSPFVLLILLASALTLQAHHISTPIQLSFGSAGGTDPVIALDSRGNIDVAWIGSSIFFTRSTDHGVSFSNPREVAPFMTTAGSLQMVLDARSNINLSWSTSNGVFFVRSTDDGEAFGTPTRINTTNFIESLQMVVERKGAIDLTWLLGSGGKLDAFFSRSTDGGATFSTPIDALNAKPTSFSSGNLQSLTGPKGQIYVFVTKTEERGESHDCTVLFSRSTDHGNTFSSPEDLSRASSGRCSTSQATVDSRGNIDVALLYASFSVVDPAPQDTLLFRRSTDNGVSFSAPVKVSGGTQFFNDADISFTKHFQIFVGSCEQIYIVWTAGNPGANTLFFARSKDNGDTFTSPEILSGPSSFGSHKDAALAVDGPGDIHVAWSDANPSGVSGPLEILFTRSRDAEKVFQNPKVLTANTGLSAVAPQMVLGSTGEAFLVWQADSPDHSATMPSQVFFGRVPASFSQPIDFTIRVSPKIVAVSPGETVQFTVTGHDVDDVRELNLVCSLLPASEKNQSSPEFESTCTFNPPSLSRSDRTAHLTLTIPPLLLPGNYFLGVSGVGNSTFNVQTVQVKVGE
jgi:hypothetical protein